MIHAAIFDWRAREVVRRQGLVYLRNWYISLIPPAFEPLLYLLAFGIGLGAHIGAITWHGATLPYLAYIAPGIITFTSFNAPFFQALYGAYVRMHYQKTWEGQLTTQVDLPHVVAGEMLWAGLQGTLYAAIVTTVIAVFAACGALHIVWWTLPLVLPLAFILGCAMALVGLLFTAIMPSIDHMNLPTFLVGFPVSVLSDTYFPVETGVPWVQAILALNPVRHCSEAMRTLLIEGRLGMDAAELCAISVVLVIVLFPIVTRLMQRRVLGE
jgi:lipooligosaccharide transport system permease protein